MPLYQLTRAGYDGSRDEADAGRPLILWVRAPAPEYLAFLGGNDVASVDDISYRTDIDDSEVDHVVRLALSYRCPRCGHGWDDVYECEVDATCPACGLRDVTPAESHPDVISPA